MENSISHGGNGSADLTATNAYHNNSISSEGLTAPKEPTGAQREEQPQIGNALKHQLKMRSAELKGELGSGLQLKFGEQSIDTRHIVDTSVGPLGRIDGRPMILGPGGRLCMIDTASNESIYAPSDVLDLSEEDLVRAQMLAQGGFFPRASVSIPRELQRLNYEIGMKLELINTRQKRDLVTVGQSSAVVKWLYHPDRGLYPDYYFSPSPPVEPEKWQHTMTRIDGVIGMESLRRKRVLFDNEQGLIAVLDNSTHVKGRVIHLEDGYEAIVAKAHFAGRKFTAQIATSSSNSFFPSSVGVPNDTQELWLRDIAQGYHSFRVLGVKSSIQIGATPLEGTVGFLSKPERRLVFKDGCDAVIGADILKLARQVVFDFENRQILLSD